MSTMIMRLKKINAACAYEVHNSQEALYQMLYTI